MIRRLVNAAVVAALALPALAGEEYTAANGYANAGYDVVAYFDLVQVPVGDDQPAAVPGRTDLMVDYAGARWAFSTEENRDRFLADPHAFMPQYDGHCAYGAAKGGKVPGNPNLWRIVDGKLYLNITRNVVGFWEEDIPGNLSRANANWIDLEAEPASTAPIPRFSPAAPVAR